MGTKTKIHIFVDLETLRKLNCYAAESAVSRSGACNTIIRTFLKEYVPLPSTLKSEEGEPNDG